MGYSDGLFDGLVFENLLNNLWMNHFNKVMELDLMGLRLVDMLMLWI